MILLIMMNHLIINQEFFLFYIHHLQIKILDFIIININNILNAQRIH